MFQAKFIAAIALMVVLLEPQSAVAGSYTIKGRAVCSNNEPIPEYTRFRVSVIVKSDSQNIPDETIKTLNTRIGGNGEFNINAVSIAHYENEVLLFEPQSLNFTCTGGFRYGESLESLQASVIDFATVKINQKP